MTRTWKTTNERLDEIAAEQRELRERQDVILLALGLAVPDYAPVERDPWADDFEEVTR